MTGSTFVNGGRSVVVTADNLDALTIELARDIVMHASERERGLIDDAFERGVRAGDARGRAGLLAEQEAEWIAAQRGRPYTAHTGPSHAQMERQRYEVDQRMIRAVRNRLPELPDTRFAWLRTLVDDEARRRRRGP